MHSLFRSIRAFLAIAILILPVAAGAQTFRGSLTGTVVDASDAAIPNATVRLTNPSTNDTSSTKTNGSGAFNFPELPVGTYKLFVTATGFSAQSFDNVVIEVSKIRDQKVQLAAGAETTVVDVEASSLQLDTTNSQLVSVVDQKSVQQIPLNGRSFMQMVKLAPGINPYLGQNSVNGSRTAGINYQIDGADNNDPWSNLVASNQGGIAGIAGGLIPVEAIDQFSLQAAGEADQGRNGGANSNMVLRTGTNHLHGDVFYFDRNELFAWLSPSVAVGSRIPEIRNHQGGFTLGGPIYKNKTFFFLAGEVQIAQANNSFADTVLNDTWIAAGKSLLASRGIAQNQVALNM